MDVASNYKISISLEKINKGFALNNDKFVSVNQGFIGPPGEFGKPVSMGLLNKACIYAYTLSAHKNVNSIYTA